MLITIIAIAALIYIESKVGMIEFLITPCPLKQAEREVASEMGMTYSQFKQWQKVTFKKRK